MTATAFLRYEPSRGSSGSEQISQHTKLNTFCSPWQGPQNLREDSWMPIVGLEYSVQVPLQNRERMLLLPVPLPPRNTSLILSYSYGDQIIQQQVLMFSLQESIDFDKFELIPRPETLPPPKPDNAVQVMSKILPNKHLSERTDDNKTYLDPEQKKKIEKKQEKSEEQEEQEKQEIIRRLTEELTRANEEGKFQKEANKIYSQVFLKISSILEMEYPDVTIENLPQYIENLREENRSYKSQSASKETKSQKNHSVTNHQSNQGRGGDLMSKVVREKEETIRNLRDQLLKSTQNNINAIFHTELSAQQCLSREIVELRVQVEELKTTSYQKPERDYVSEKSIARECPHHQKISTLIKNYEEMLKEYHRNERVVQDLKNHQEQSYAYFSALRAELAHTVQVNCNNYSDLRLKELDQRIQNALHELSVPQKVRSEADNDVRVRELLNETQRLNERLSKKQLQMYQVVKRLQEEAEKSSWKEYQAQLMKLTTLQEQLKEKKKKAKQLSNTIIEGVDTRKFVLAQDCDQSQVTFNSQESDLIKQQNNVRNLKAIVHSLKQENEKLKTKLKDATMANSDNEMVEKVSEDEHLLKIVEAMLLGMRQENGRCQCLEKVTEIVLAFAQESPQLEEILINVGLMETSSTLLAGMSDL